MNFNVTCILNQDNQIQASIEPIFSSWYQYEMAIKEIILPVNLQVERGTIQVYQETSVLFTINLDGFEGEDIQKYIVSFQMACRKRNIDQQSVNWTHNNSLITFFAASPYSIKFSDKAKIIFKSNKTYVTNHELYMSSQLLSQTVIHILSDVAAEQIFGDTKKKILKSIPLDFNQSRLVYLRFENPDYIDVSRTLWSKVNVWLEDSNNFPIKVDGLKNLFIKLHFRPKK